MTNEICFDHLIIAWWIHQNKILAAKLNLNGSTLFCNVGLGWHGLGATQKIGSATWKLPNWWSYLLAQELQRPDANVLNLSHQNNAHQFSGHSKRGTPSPSAGDHDQPREIKIRSCCVQFVSSTWSDDILII